ncbi:hypothetical protein [Kribbella sp. NPDC003557]|uniref:hypothetical protein n=1 Tax=Kribbella sp. NPDC003557 TaxID=3154449 RepID=UPI0033ABABD7
MSTSELLDGLEAIDHFLAAQPFAVRQLHPPASMQALEATAAKLRIEIPEIVRTMYRWRDGAVPEPGGRELFLFPPYWQYMPLSWVEKESEGPLAWCRAIGVAGFPVARDPAGQFLVVQSGSQDVLLEAAYDGVAAAWPDGTMLGMVNATRQALAGEHVEFEAVFSAHRMEWVFPDRESGND